MGAVNRPPPRCWSNHAKGPRLPMFKRAAIQAKRLVVLARKSRASSTFPRSRLRRALRSASLHRSRLRPSTTSLWVEPAAGALGSRRALGG